MTTLGFVRTETFWLTLVVSVVVSFCGNDVGFVPAGLPPALYSWFLFGFVPICRFWPAFAEDHVKQISSVVSGTSALPFHKDFPSHVIALSTVVSAYCWTQPKAWLLTCSLQPFHCMLKVQVIGSLVHDLLVSHLANLRLRLSRELEKHLGEAFQPPNFLQPTPTSKSWMNVKITVTQIVPQ